MISLNKISDCMMKCEPDSQIQRDYNTERINEHLLKNARLVGQTLIYILLRFCLLSSLSKQEVSTLLPGSLRVGQHSLDAEDHWSFEFRCECLSSNKRWDSTSLMISIISPTSSFSSSAFMGLQANVTSHFLVCFTLFAGKTKNHQPHQQTDVKFIITMSHPSKTLIDFFFFAIFSYIIIRICMVRMWCMHHTNHTKLNTPLNTFMVYFELRKRGSYCNVCIFLTSYRLKVTMCLTLHCLKAFNCGSCTHTKLTTELIICK